MFVMHFSVTYPDFNIGILSPIEMWAGRPELKGRLSGRSKWQHAQLQK